MARSGPDNGLIDIDEHLNHWKPDPQQRSLEESGAKADTEYDTSLTIIIVLFILMLCSCFSVCIRYIVVARAARRVRGPAMIPNAMMMGKGQPATGGMMHITTQQNNGAPMGRGQQVGMYPKQPGSGPGGGYPITPKKRYGGLASSASATSFESSSSSGKSPEESNLYDI